MSAIEFVKSWKSGKPDFQNIVNFMVEFMERSDDGYPDWFLGASYVFGDRYNQLEVGEFGSFYIYKDCDEFYEWLLTQFEHPIPHYKKNRDAFFLDTKYANKFFELYEKEEKYFNEDKSVFLENIVADWNARYGNMTESEIFMKASDIRKKLSVRIPSVYNHSTGTWSKTDHPIDLKLELIDLFYYCVFYKYDIRLSICKANQLKIQIDANHPDFRSYYNHAQYTYVSKTIFDQVIYHDDKVLDLFPDIEIAVSSEESSMYEFEIPEGICLYWSDIATKEWQTINYSQRVRIGDALKAFNISLHDGPFKNMGSGDGIAVLFMRDGTFNTCELMDSYCDETWE